MVSYHQSLKHSFKVPENHIVFICNFQGENDIKIELKMTIQILKIAKNAESG